MNIRHLVAVGTALAAATAGLLVASPAEAKPARLHDVKTTMSLRASGKPGYEVVSTGRAPAHARVYLQDHPGGHRWVTRKAGRASARGTFSLSDETKEINFAYRTCLARPGADVCTRPAVPRLVRITGTIDEVSHPDVFTPVATQSVTAAASPVLKGRPIRLQYRNPATKKWVGTGYELHDDHTGTLSTGPIRGLDVGGLAVQLRLASPQDAWHAPSYSKTFTAASYRGVPLADLPVASGAVDTKDSVIIRLDAFWGSFSSLGVAPRGTAPTNTATVSLGSLCTDVIGGVVNDDNVFPNPADFTTSIAVDGVTVFTHATMSDPFEYDIPVTGKQQVTLTSSYDGAHPDWRPWFVASLTDLRVPDTTRQIGALAVCAR